jgi:hypothetical protein
MSSARSIPIVDRSNTGTLPPRGGKGRVGGVSAAWSVEAPFGSTPLARGFRHCAFTPTQPSPLEGEGY